MCGSMQVNTGLYSILPLRKCGRVAHPQSMDKSSPCLNVVCLFTKSEMYCNAGTILMEVPEVYLHMHGDIFQIKGAMME